MSVRRPPGSNSGNGSRGAQPETGREQLDEVKSGTGISSFGGTESAIDNLK
jgi:hypothetical protein